MPNRWQIANRFRQISRQNAPKPQRLVPHECERTTTSGRLARNLTEPVKAGNHVVAEHVFIIGDDLELDLNSHGHSEG